MSWFKYSKTGITEQELSRKLKDTIRTNPFFVNMFREYGVPTETIDNNLVFKIVDLEGKFAQSDSKTIYLNENLFENGKFFTDNMHFFVHELIHWLTRQKEKEVYFADPEEVEAFSSQIAYEILKGKKREEITKVFFPIIKSHFEQKQNANKLFEALFAKAILRAK